MLGNRRLLRPLLFPHSRAPPLPRCYYLFTNVSTILSGRLTLHWCQKTCLRPALLFLCLLSIFLQDLVRRHFWSPDLDLELSNSDLLHFCSAVFSVFCFSRIFLLPRVFLFLVDLLCRSRSGFLIQDFLFV